VCNDGVVKKFEYNGDTWTSDDAQDVSILPSSDVFMADFDGDF
jgi:hypothetical protein